MMSKGSNFIRNIVVLCDFAVVNVVLGLFYLYFHGGKQSGYTNVYFLLLCANLSMIVAQFMFSTIVHRHYKSIDKVMKQVCLLSLSYAVCFFLSLQMGKFYFGESSPEAHFSIWSTVTIVVSLFMLRIVEYFSIKRLRVFGYNSRSLLFVGEAEKILQAYNEIDTLLYTGLKVKGYYSDKPIAQEEAKMEHLGTLKDLKVLIDTANERLADDIYCTETDDDKELVTQLVDYSIRYGIQFNFVPSIMKDFGYYLRPRVEGELIVFSNMNEPLLHLGNRIVKRTFDIVVSGIVIIFLLPLIPIIGAIIKLSSPGPIFFRQKRTGLNGEDFHMLKFRSMHVNKDADRLQATRDDPRKFAFGNFMRKSNIDELPQFINVFLGDMSIVGPRPHMLAHTEEYRHKIYEYMLRHMARPGITGWAQVTGFRGETPELWQMSGRVQRDLWYIQNWSFWLDIRIILRTAKQIIIHDKNAF